MYRSHRKVLLMFFTYSYYAVITTHIKTIEAVVLLTMTNDSKRPLHQLKKTTLNVHTPSKCLSHILKFILSRTTFFY